MHASFPNFEDVVDQVCDGEELSYTESSEMADLISVSLASETEVDAAA